MALFRNFTPNHWNSARFLLKIMPFSIQFRNLDILSKASKRKIFCSYSFFSFLYPYFFPCKRPAVEKQFLKFRNSAKKPCFFPRFLLKSRLFLVLFRNSIVILMFLSKKAGTWFLDPLHVPAFLLRATNARHGDLLDSHRQRRTLILQHPVFYGSRAQAILLH